MGPGTVAPETRGGKGAERPWSSDAELTEAGKAMANRDPAGRSRHDARRDEPHNSSGTAELGPAATGPSESQRKFDLELAVKMRAG